jgi:hypothetical protein
MTAFKSRAQIELEFFWRRENPIRKRLLLDFSVIALLSEPDNKSFC